MHYCINLYYHEACRVHPYILFSSNRVSVKMCVGMYLISSAGYSCLCTFWSYFLVLPSLLASSIYLVAFYTCLCHFFLSRATARILGYSIAAEGCGLKPVGRSVWQSHLYKVMAKCLCVQQIAKHSYCTINQSSSETRVYNVIADIAT